MHSKGSVLKLVTVVIAGIAVLLLISGLVLGLLSNNSYSAAAETQMPEEYIEEFFPDEAAGQQIENYIEPEG